MQQRYLFYVRYSMNTKTNNIMSEKTAVEQISNILKSKGQFVSVAFRSDVKPSASYKSFKLHKQTKAVVRAGIDFANLSTVKKGIANGERLKVGALPWGTWFKFPYIIENKGDFYLRLYPSIANIPNVEYFVNGAKVTKIQFGSFLTPSEKAKLFDRQENAVEVFNVKSSNIMNIE